MTCISLKKNHNFISYQDTKNGFKCLPTGNMRVAMI